MIGDKAQGKVQLLNKTTAEKTFAAGTVLTTGELTFTLDSDVTVASASVSESSDAQTKTFGKVESAVTASEIGADSNIAKDTKLTVATFDTSSYEATVVDTFTGGSSREVRVVSQKDQTDLQTELLKELAAQAEQSFAQDAPAGSYTVGTGESTTLDENYDAKVGDEANNMTLALTASFAGIQYAAADLKPLAAAVLADQIPAGYQLAEQDPDILSTPTSEASTSSQVKLDAEVTAKAVPQISAEQLAAQISGQQASEAIKQLEDRPEIVSAAISFQPSWLGALFNWLPATEKIKITLN